jgi:hypothetical protein
MNFRTPARAGTDSMWPSAGTSDSQLLADDVESRREHASAHARRRSRRQGANLSRRHSACRARARSGQPCQAPAMPNGRCRIHGGKATGAPKGNRNAVKHGFYSAEIVAHRRKVGALLRAARKLVRAADDCRNHYEPGTMQSSEVRLDETPSPAFHVAIFFAPKKPC